MAFPWHVLDGWWASDKLYKRHRVTWSAALLSLPVKYSLLFSVTVCPRLWNGFKALFPFRHRAWLCLCKLQTTASRFSVDRIVFESIRFWSSELLGDSSFHYLSAVCCPCRMTHSCVSTVGDYFYLLWLLMRINELTCTFSAYLTYHALSLMTQSSITPMLKQHFSVENVISVVFCRAWGH